MPTEIQWADEVWNCVRGCSRVSSGCGDSTGGGCYAERQAYRFSGPGMPYEGLVRMTSKGPRWTGKVVLVEDKLNEPLKWAKPRRVFVNSMSDLFHESLSDEQIDRVFAVMALAQQHTFQVLTKRPERMRQWFATKDSPLDESRADIVMERAARSAEIVWDARGSNPSLYLNASKADVSNRRPFPGWPIPNVWLGVSVEDQKTADERIPLLLQTPAAVRWISAEPLLGPVEDVFAHVPDCDCSGGHDRGCRAQRRIGWVVAGGESGPKARPMHPDWARSLRDQCVAAGVPFFFKQWGAFMPLASVFNDDDQMFPFAAGLADERKSIAVDEQGSIYWNEGDGPPVPPEKKDAYAMSCVGKKASGRLLDGVEWNQFPEPNAVTATA